MSEALDGSALIFLFMGYKADDNSLFKIDYIYTCFVDKILLLFILEF